MANPLAYRIGSFQKPHLPFKRVAQLGIPQVELVWNDQTSVDEVGDLLVPLGMQVASLHVPSPLDDDGLPDKMAGWAECAMELGAHHLFVSIHAGEMARDEAYGRIRKLGDAVAKAEVYLAMETHPDLCQNAANMLETMAAVAHPWVGVNYDTANVYYYNEGVDTVAELTKAVAQVRGVHLKDTHGGFHDGSFPVFGEGVVDFAGVERVLREGGYKGPLVMELEGGAFDAAKPDDLAAKVERCVHHLRATKLAR
ncbi:MAG: sugar phosphate isomerase/epimerase family protein [Gemmatimonadota bacterium]